MDYQLENGFDGDGASPLKTRNDGSDTDFQANGGESDMGDGSSQTESVTTEQLDLNQEPKIRPIHAAPKQRHIKGETDLSMRPLPKNL